MYEVETKAYKISVYWSQADENDHYIPGPFTREGIKVCMVHYQRNDNITIIYSIYLPQDYNNNNNNNNIANTPVEVT